MIVKLFLFAFFYMTVCHVNGVTLENSNINQPHHNLKKTGDRLILENRRATRGAKEIAKSRNETLDEWMHREAEFWHKSIAYEEEFNKTRDKAITELANYFDKMQQKLTIKMELIREDERKLKEGQESLAKKEAKLTEKRIKFEAEKKEFETNREAECKKLDICKGGGGVSRKDSDKMKIEFNLKLNVEGSDKTFKLTDWDVSKDLTPDTGSKTKKDPE